MLVLSLMVLLLMRLDADRMTGQYEVPCILQLTLKVDTVLNEQICGKGSAHVYEKMVHC